MDEAVMIKGERKSKSEKQNLREERTSFTMVNSSD